MAVLAVIRLRKLTHTGTVHVEPMPTRCFLLTLCCCQDQRAVPLDDAEAIFTSDASPRHVLQRVTTSLGLRQPSARPGPRATSASQNARIALRLRLGCSASAPTTIAHREHIVDFTTRLRESELARRRHCDAMLEKEAELAV